MRFVCPKLTVWKDIYRSANRLIPGLPPPLPPSVDEWALFTDDAKEIKWSLMYSWLEGHGLEELAECLCDSEWYVADVRYVDYAPDSSYHPYGIDPLLD